MPNCFVVKAVLNKVFLYDKIFCLEFDETLNIFLNIVRINLTYFFNSDVESKTYKKGAYDKFKRETRANFSSITHASKSGTKAYRFFRSYTKTCSTRRR